MLQSGDELQRSLDLGQGKYLSRCAVRTPGDLEHGLEWAAWSPSIIGIWLPAQVTLL